MEAAQKTIVEAVSEMTVDQLTAIERHILIDQLKDTKQYLRRAIDLLEAISETMTKVG